MNYTTIPFKYNIKNPTSNKKKTITYRLLVSLLNKHSIFDKRLFPLVNQSQRVPIRLIVHEYISLKILSYKISKSKRRRSPFSCHQPDGSYIFPKSFCGENLVLRKIYDIAGLGGIGKSLKWKLNPDNLDNEILHNYLSDYSEDIPLKIKSSINNEYILLYSQFLTNLWTFLTVQSNHGRTIRNNLIEEIGKLNKQLKKHKETFVVGICIEKSPIYDSKIFSLFIEGLSQTPFCQCEVKKISAQEAIALHFKLLIEFNSRFIESKGEIQYYPAYIPLSKYKDVIKKNNDNKMFWNNFENLIIDPETGKMQVV